MHDIVFAELMAIDHLLSDSRLTLSLYPSSVSVLGSVNLPKTLSVSRSHRKRRHTLDKSLIEKRNIYYLYTEDELISFTALPWAQKVSLVQVSSEWEQIPRERESA